MKFRTYLTLSLVFALAACGGDSGGGEGEVIEIVKWTPSGDNQSGVAGQALPLVLRVKVTADGAVSAGHQVVWTGPGTFGTPSMVTGSNGIATTTWTLPTEAGVVHATATLDDAVGSPLTFNATVTPDVATHMVKISGDNQSTVRAEIFNAPFVIQVVDQYGNGKEGVTVNWSASGPADVLTATSPTDPLGFGRGYLTAQDALGVVTLTATIEGLTGSPQVFTGAVIGATSIVTVHDNFYSPSALTISAGGAVQWQLVGSGHTITSTGGGVIPNSGVLSSPSTWGPVLFTNSGVYTYQCSEHPVMTGSITVNP